MIGIKHTTRLHLDNKISHMNFMVWNSKEEEWRVTLISTMKSNPGINWTVCWSPRYKAQTGWKLSLDKYLWKIGWCLCPKDCRILKLPCGMIFVSFYQWPFNIVIQFNENVFSKKQEVYKNLSWETFPENWCSLLFTNIHASVLCKFCAN